MIDKSGSGKIHEVILVYISSLSLHDCYMKLTSFTPPLYKVGEQNTKMFLFFF